MRLDPARAGWINQQRMAIIEMENGTGALDHIMVFVLRR